MIGQILLISFIPHEEHFMASPFIIIKLMASASAFAPTKPNTFIGLLSQRGSSYLEQNHPLDLEYSVTPCSSFFNPNQIAWGPGIIPKCQLASF